MSFSIIGDGDSKNFLQLIQEKSDDISEAVIVPPGWRVACDGVPISPVLEKTILLLVKPNGGVIPVPADQDIQMILKDGILERMNIPLRNVKQQGEPLAPATLIPPA